MLSFKADKVRFIARCSCHKMKPPPHTHSDTVLLPSVRSDKLFLRANVMSSQLHRRQFSFSEINISHHKCKTLCAVTATISNQKNDAAVTEKNFHQNPFLNKLRAAQTDSLSDFVKND